MLTEAAIFLAAAVLAVPISSRLGLGTVLGYLAAGVLIGPSGLRLATRVDETLHIAELGVVLLLFLIGLELQPSRLWRMRAAVFGVGGVQVGVTSVLLLGGALLLGVPWQAGLVAAVGLAMSSTAFALQILGEKRELTQPHGQAAFGILLFQDLAAIPALAFIPALGSGASQGHSGARAAITFAVLVGLVLVGRYLLRPLLRFIASARSHEVSAAAALLVVIGTSLLMQAVGLSMALGAFMAGVLLADSEYRHELEANIEPFKGLLLGLFFISVGMSANLGVLVARPAVVVGLAVVLTVVKAVVLTGLGRARGLSRHGSVSLGIALAQGGEFGFVLFGVGREAGVLPREVLEILVVAVTLSMGLTPLLFLARDRLLAKDEHKGRPFDVVEEHGSRVILAGFGRFGQIVGRILRVKRIPFTALEVNPTQVDFVRRFGNRIYYGDASRVDLLRAAHADKAELFVLAIDDMEASLRTAKVVQEHFPHLRIIARARNRQHAYALLGLGIPTVVRETFAASLEAGRATLEALGCTPDDAARTVTRFGSYDENQVRKVYALRDDEAALIASAKAYSAELERIFEEDAQAAS